jgi:hypothetical protein
MTCRSVVRGFLTVVLAGGLAACSSISTGTAASPTSGGAATAPSKIERSPTTTAATRASFHVAQPLPSEGLAIETGGRIRLLDLQGGEVGTITGGTLEGAGEPARPDLTVHDSVGWYRLSPGRSDPTVVTGAQAPPDLFGCHDTIGSRVTLVVCNDASYTTEPTISIRTARGLRRVVGSPFPKVAGRYAGFWRWAQPSPDGAWVLGQWSGECEVPEALLVPAAGGSPRTFDASPLSHPTQSIALGWTESHDAVVRLQSGVCGTGSPSPGVYRAHPGGSLHLIVAAQDTATIVMWS